MNSRPEGDTRKDRRARGWLMLGIAILLFSVVGNVGLGELNLMSQNNHHASTVKKETEILSLIQTVHDAQITNKGTLTTIATLSKEVATVIEGLPAADAAILTEAAALAEDIASVCASTHADCAPLPPLP